MIRHFFGGAFSFYRLSLIFTVHVKFGFRIFIVTTFGET